jgi:hypothetical protein
MIKANVRAAPIERLYDQWEVDDDESSPLKRTFAAQAGSPTARLQAQSLTGIRKEPILLPGAIRGCWRVRSPRNTKPANEGGLTTEC